MKDKVALFVQPDLTLILLPGATILLKGILRVYSV